MMRRPVRVLPSAEREALLRDLTASAKGTKYLIVPGTPDFSGFSALIRKQQELISKLRTQRDGAETDDAGTSRARS